MSVIGAGQAGTTLTEARLRELCAAEVGRWDIRGRRVLALVPDQTRSGPIEAVFRIFHDLVAREAAAFDVMIALGTHPPMSDAAIDQRLGLAPGERAGRYAATRFFNHTWDDPGALVSVGALHADEVGALSGGRLRGSVDVRVNRRALDYDLLLVIGPTFPHEVVGFSGGNKYLVPGIAGPEIIDMFHWLGALITNAAIIGTKHTPVRAVVDRAAALVPVERRCASLVVDGPALAGLYLGTPEEAWSAAADLSAQIHVVCTPRPYRSVLSCAPAMYDELWVGGKCAYKLEPVVADGGELVIYAPHLREVSAVHGATIRRIGYHVRDYFLAQMDRFRDIPLGVLAHSTHVKGAGRFEAGVERPRIQITLATGIPEAECRALNLGYRDPRGIDPTAWMGREDEGLLHVPKAGETLYKLRPSDPTRSTSS